MKTLPWLSVMILASQSLIACGDDTDSVADPGTAGGVSRAGAPGAGASNGGAPGAGAPGAGAPGAGAPSAGASSAGASSAGAPGAGAPSGGAPSAGAPGSSGAAGEGGSGGADMQTKDIVDTAIAAGNFTKLAAALTSAGLVEALKGPGPFTVFAPNDAAFAAFEAANKGVLAGLTKAQLTEILTYHVVAGAAQAKDLKDEQVFTTLSGSPILIDTTGGVKVDNAKVTTADIIASNGVIHVIDTIIIPPKDDIVATAVAAGMFTKLAGALTSAGLVPTLQGKGPFTVFAPTDAAFAKLATVPTGDALKNVLLYHVVAGAVGSGDLKAGPVPTQLTGKSVTVDLTGGVKINDAKVTTANVLAKNGVIHIVDTVLVPQ